MKFLPYTGLDTDNPYWVTREQFLNNFDQDDFINNRESKNVVDGYLRDWFYTSDEGIEYFILPTVQLISEKTQFINGRHRTAVLLKHLQIIPIAFDQSFNNNNTILANIKNNPVDPGIAIDLPNLQMFDVLP